MTKKRGGPLSKEKRRIKGRSNRLLLAHMMEDVGMGEQEWVKQFTNSVLVGSRAYLA